MALSSTRRRSPGGPQIEGLREAKDLRATASPQAIYSYDEKHADYIERPQWGPNGWDRLAQALGRLNPTLNTMMAHKNEQFREEQTAIGKELMQRNKVAWADFVKANPEYAGLNPHLERGYKAAELSSKSQDFQAALQDFYTTGSLMNETDPEKVRTSLNDFSKGWVSDNISQEAFEPDLYAENFFKPAEAAEGALMNRHTSDRAQEHVRLAKEKYARLFGQSIDTVLDNTPDISNPDVFTATLTTLKGNLERQMAEAEASGLLRSEVNSVVEDAIINLAKSEGAEGYGKRLLKLADNIQTGSGTLGGRPEFKAKVKALNEHLENEARAKRSEYRQEREFQQRESARQAKKEGYDFIVTSVEKDGKVPDLASIIQLPGVGRDNVDVAVAVHTSLSSAIKSDEYLFPKKTNEHAEALQNAMRGKISDPNLPAFVQQFGLREGREIYEAAIRANEGNDPLSRALQGPAFREGEKIVQDQILAGIGISSSPYQNIVELRKREAVRVFTTDYINWFNEYLNKNNNTAPNRWVQDKFIQDTAYQLGKDERFRDIQTQRDIQSPEYHNQRLTPEFWKENTIAYLGTQKQAKEILIKTLDPDPANSRKAFEEIMNEFNLQTKQLQPFMENQLQVNDLKGWYDAEVNKINAAAKQKKRDHQAAKKRLSHFKIQY